MQKKRGLYAITDCDRLTDTELLEKTEIILQSGASVLQYRDKLNDSSTKVTLAKKLKQLCHTYDSLFIINDDVELAKQTDADGVHIGKDDANVTKARTLIGDKIIGVSCYNNFENALMAEKQGADYVAFGSFFPSDIKPNAVKADVSLLIEAKQRLSIPIVAIGGITQDNSKQLIEAGADFLAVISALYQAENTQQATSNFINLFQ